MAESYNDIAIKLGIDADGVASGFQRAKAMLFEWRQDVGAVFVAANAKELDAQVNAYRNHLKDMSDADEAFKREYEELLDQEFQAAYAKEERLQALKDAEIMRELEAEQNALQEKKRLMAMETSEQARYLAVEREQDERAGKERTAALKARLEAESAAERQALAEREAMFRSQSEANASRMGTALDPYADPAFRGAGAERMRLAKLRDAEAAKKAAEANQRYHNELQQINAIIQRNMTPGERYLQQMNNLNRLQYIINKSTKESVLSTRDYTREKTRLTIATIRAQQAEAGFNRTMAEGRDIGRQMTGVVAQLSFGMEDFVQGMVFGDLRSALLGSINNFSMVARQLREMQSSGLSFIDVIRAAYNPVVALAAGITAVGAAAYYSFRSGVLEDMRDFAKASDDAAKALGFLERNLEARKHERKTDEEILRLKDVDDALRLLGDRHKQLADIKDEIATKELRNRLTADEEMMNLFGGPTAFDELREYLKLMDTAFGGKYADEAAKVRDLIGQVKDQIRDGEAENVIKTLREMYQILNSVSGKPFGGGPKWEFFDPTTLNRLENLFGPNWTDFAENTNELSSIMERIRQKSDELKDAKQDQKLLEEDILKFNKEVEKSLERQAELAKDLGPGGLNNLMGMMLNPADFTGAGGLGFAADMAGMFALQAMMDEMEKEKKENQDTPLAQSALMQNAFEAQSQAFKQIYEAAARKPDKQLEELNKRMTEVRDALKQTTPMKIVP